MLPNFLIIGSTKCGTSSLHRFLRGHPNVFMHPRKELRFFTIEHNWHRGLSWYTAEFSGACDKLAIGEASNAYTRHPLYSGVPERIHQLMPDVKLLYLMRHPMERMESHYRHRLVTGIEFRSPQVALREDAAYLAASLYGHQLQEYLRYFRRDQILPLRLERLLGDPRETLRRVCNFLGIGDALATEFPRKNVTSERVVTPPALRQLSRFSFLRDRIRTASQILGHSVLWRDTQSADQPKFELDRHEYQKLAKTLREDKALLQVILGETLDEWEF